MLIKIDKTSLFHGFKLENPGGTPSWNTSFGQGKQYDPKAEYLELFKHFNASQVENVEIEYRRKGSSQNDDRKHFGLIKFENVSFNGVPLNSKMCLLAYKQVGTKNHDGRMHFRYGPTKLNGEIWNEELFSEISEKIGKNWVVFTFDVNFSTSSLDLIGFSTDEDVLLINSNARQKYWAYNQELVAPYTGNRNKKLPKYYDKIKIVLENYLVNGKSLREIDKIILSPTKKISGDYSKSLLNDFGVDSSDKNKGVLKFVDDEISSKIIENIAISTRETFDLEKFKRVERKQTKARISSERNFYEKHDEMVAVIHAYAMKYEIIAGFECMGADVVLEKNKREADVIEVKSSQGEIDKAIGQLLRYQIRLSNIYDKLNLFICVPSFNMQNKYMNVLEKYKIVVKTIDDFSIK